MLTPNFENSFVYKIMKELPEDNLAAVLGAYFSKYLSINPDMSIKQAYTLGVYATEFQYLLRLVKTVQGAQLGLNQIHEQDLDYLNKTIDVIEPILGEDFREWAETLWGSILDEWKAYHQNLKVTADGVDYTYNITYHDD